VKRKFLHAASLLLLLTILASLFYANHAAALWSGTITILSDGTIDPVGAPISQTGNWNVLTDDVQGSIIIQKDNIVFDGAGHNIQGTDKSATGIDISGRVNVTIKNMVIMTFNYGIYLESSNQNTISGNLITNNVEGVYLTVSIGNTICWNVMEANDYDGVFVDSSSNNNIFGNNITGNAEGVYSQYSANDRIFHNNFNGNGAQVGINSTDAWDDGYPSGGNYWSNYQSIDIKCGPNQDHPGSDAIGDTPYAIGVSNTDNYPLMNPWAPPTGHNVAIIALISSKTVIGQGYSGNITVYGANKGAYSEIFNVTAYGNTTQIASTTVPLASGSTTTLTFSWNTTIVSKGNYIASAYAQPVPNEANTTDNNYTDSWISVSIPGDINGDFKVDLRDLVLLANAYGTTPASGGIPGDWHAWNPNADIDNNSVVALTDLVILANHYGQHNP
jgi:parallel beta-helix repeat protein